MGTMHLLATCEIFRRIAASGGEEIARHIGPMMQVLASCRPRALRPEIECCLRRNCEVTLCGNCIPRRKAMACLEFSEHAMAMGTKFGATTALAQASIRVPAALEECDDLRAQGSSITLCVVMGGMTRLTELEDDRRGCPGF
ncbi:hypothetical protein DOTSEDRAFT_32808 [Dothistroma septosporum NZE10]|uniref:Uncharacterized protein n=1 Tax=Dothistroma septosporum (strain NZE10 / CBS 128990) TaxID=675120 RepID=N1PT69_DOTSN|nr:hypothetical protein DOTSEDRAFT_32808 [Dothistroma septosporum NZE10]